MDTYDDKENYERNWFYKEGNTRGRLRRQLGRATQLLRKSLAKGDVPYADIEDSIDLIMNNVHMSHKFDTLLEERNYVNRMFAEHLEKYDIF
ncbi:unnamed protein product [Strongylus vulgaris]|uniref:Uncharacterized protein n=1 Tax=Strongylus vulgaris TaxID=40348 RepID=A0A3P7J1K8_STRVU|nr:unnamed protein product [Strongylus vulgaris]